MAMRIRNVKITNFRSLSDVDVDLRPFACAVGHNNAGKSSFLVAMSLLRSGSKLKASDYYDTSCPVSIQATVDGIDEEALDRLDEKHRTKVAELVNDGRIVFVRTYPGPGEKSTLRCLRRSPIEERYSEEGQKQAITGSGTKLRANFLRQYPELEGELSESVKKQADFRAVLDRHIAGMPDDQLGWVESPLPTGIDQSVIELIPEPIFIPAANDARDELKTSESASFGKLIAVLMELIRGTEDFKQIEESFSQLSRLLNRPEDGSDEDSRIEAVRDIEQTVGRYVTEQFRDVKVKIEVPPPSLREVFRNAKILLDDGVEGDVESKGDGVKRAVTFALLRTFVDFQQRSAGRVAERVSGRFLFLFEEPELYLHPNAQRILFDALVQIAATHQVCVCTHSPYFFSPQDEGTFLRIAKTGCGTDLAPSTNVRLVQLHEQMSLRDLYQVLCYENNSAAFFCERVLLVEGPSDVVFLQHVAKRLNPRWDFMRENIAVVKCGGKGGLRRFRGFMESCGVDVRIVTDLDTLVDGFDQLDPTPEERTAQSRLLQNVDDLIAHEAAEPTKSVMSQLVRKRTFRERYEQVRKAVKALHNGEEVDPDAVPDFDVMFGDESQMARRRMLAEAPQVAEERDTLINMLATRGVHVLSRGAIEDYYPDGTTGGDKTTRAIDACTLVSDERRARACSEPLCDDPNGEPELVRVFGAVFGAASEVRKPSEGPATVAT